MWQWWSLALAAALSCLAIAEGSCLEQLDGWREASVEERARRSPVVLHGLAIERFPTPADSAVGYKGHFWLINVYKGADLVAQALNLEPGAGGVGNLRDRRINVTGFGPATPCAPAVAPQRYYIIFAEVRPSPDGTGSILAARYDDIFAAIANWTEGNEKLVWSGAGWDAWSDWAACSVTCGAGVQERHRLCHAGRSCKGYNKEQRRCNSFPCQGAINPLGIEDRRYFHPSRGQWARVPERPTAWRLRPNSYLWIPTTELTPGGFPREFTLLVTLRLHPQSRAQGTVFSLRSRRQQDAYLSVELAGGNALKVVHAGPNGTQTVEIPAKLADARWHQLAIGIHDDSSVRSYLDCRWVSTDVLKRNSLDTPQDADIVIGYLFQGDLEQLTILPAPDAVGTQCGSQRTPVLDAELLATVTAAPPGTDPHGRRSKARKGVIYPMPDRAENSIPDLVTSSTTTPLPTPETVSSVGVTLRRQDINEEEDEEDYKENSVDEDEEEEGSGGEGFGNHDENNYEVEWSEWSECSVSCGEGVQTRYSRCVDDGSRLELCVEAGGERTENRKCSRGPCPTPPTQKSRKSGHHRSRGHRRIFHEIKRIGSNGTSDLDLPRVAYNVTPLAEGESCGCLNGGQCGGPRRRCLCAKGFSGRHCERLVSIQCSSTTPCLNGARCNEAGRCTDCPEGYTGKRCQIPICEGGCMNGGRCVKPNMCICPSGWVGHNCNTPVCEPECRHGGQCIQPHTCRCPPGASGPICQNFACREPCLNGGACVGPDLCECPRNTTGPTCNEPLCDPPCENSGTCAQGNTCVCEPGSSGTRCQKRKCEYRPYQEPYTRGFRRLVNKRYETKCDPWGWKTCVRTQPEYQTVYKTFYRTVYRCADSTTANETQHPPAEERRKR